LRCIFQAVCARFFSEIRSSSGQLPRQFGLLRARARDPKSRADLSDLHVRLLNHTRYRSRDWLRAVSTRQPSRANDRRMRVDIEATLLEEPYDIAARGIRITPVPAIKTSFGLRSVPRLHNVSKVVRVRFKMAGLSHHTVASRGQVYNALLPQSEFAAADVSRGD